MQLSKSRLLHDTLRRYVRRQAWSHLDRILDKTRMEEIATAMATMVERDQAAIFERVTDPEDKATLICAMQAPFGKNVLDRMPPVDAAAVLREMAQDDMADIIADLEPEQAARVLEILDESDEVEDLMRYRDDTAGGIMLPEFVSVSADMTAEEALMALREKSDDVEMVYYIYVVNVHGHLVGVLSMRKLVVAPTHRRISEIMETDILSVTSDTDQEEVARLVAEYDLLAIPVVDDSNKLLGIVTVDDVIDVLKEEAEEDFLKMGGVGGTTFDGDPAIGRHVRVRFPWLLASCASGLLAAATMGMFEETLASHQFLALFLPIILGMSGNVGTQSATVTVRGIAMGFIRYGERSFEVVKKEITIGLAMGALYGVIVGLVATLFGGDIFYGLTIGLSITCGMVLASAVGTLVPILLEKLSVDPAVATGPFVTTSIDILGVLIYFSIAAGLAVLLL